MSLACTASSNLITLPWRCDRPPLPQAPSRPWQAGCHRRWQRVRASSVAAKVSAPAAAEEGPALPSHGGFELRDYQREAIAAIQDAFSSRGVCRQLVALPTGAGKTVIFCHLARQLGRRTLVLVHRAELVQQTVDRMQAVWPGVQVGVLKQGSRQMDQQVVVASVQTAMRPKTLQQLAAQGFELIIVDEAHHAPAASYTSILSSLGSLEGGTIGSDDDSRQERSSASSREGDGGGCGGGGGSSSRGGGGSSGELDTEQASLLQLSSSSASTLLVGFTATPFRLDKKSLGEVFQDIVYQRDLRYMVAQGFLVPPVGYRIITEEDLSQARRTKAGDFKERELECLVNTPRRNALAARAYLECAPGRRAIVFCVGVQHALDMAEAFRAEGVACEAVHGQLSPAEREGLLARFSAGEIQALTNCMILTEGYDETSVSCVVMARPTRSTGLYMQCIGRGLRLHAGKQDLVVLDLTDRHHEFAGVASLRRVYSGRTFAVAGGDGDGDLPPPPGPPTVNLMAALPRGRVQLLESRYSWVAFPGTPHHFM